jgi:hypothetical protein
MKLFSPKGKPLNRAAARNATLLNLFATPGLGSILARRWIAGIGQLAVFLAGFVLFCDWSFSTIGNYYAQAFSDNPQPTGHLGKIALWGVVLCTASWLWSLVTSFSLMREASSGNSGRSKISPRRRCKNWTGQKSPPRSPWFQTGS